jgi:hypothetical protein
VGGHSHGLGSERKTEAPAGREPDRYKAAVIVTIDAPQWAVELGDASRRRRAADRVIFEVDTYPDEAGDHVSAHAYLINGDGVIVNLGGDRVPVPSDRSVLWE